MKSKEEAIAEIRSILDGSGCYEQRRLYPEDMRGMLAVLDWNSPVFTLGFEYGIIGTLMRYFDISEEDIFNADKNKTN